jgi:NADH-ubiquinone oxidoreductase chain 5
MINRPNQIFSTSRIIIWILVLLIIYPTIYVVFTQKTILLEWTLLTQSATPILITLVADPIGIIFSCTVLFISANVLRFSTIYIKDDKFTNRFTILVLLFILSINLLIFIPHFIILLLGWDGLGIVSFILVIYYQNPKSLAAGIITALTNRVGDVILLLSIAWTLNQGHWFIINIWESNSSIIQVVCIRVAAITKSAQIPFSRWLPAAIAAPTPVSALVHSSTLVTAGVFIIIRFYPFLSSINYFTTAMLAVAISTILIAGLRATTECDIKKIIALSTLRQLGIIITRIGLRIPHLAFFHIITHALFKALLFICAGSFINQHLHSQDLRWIGNLTKQIPVAMSCITIANMALCGFPFIAGFYSKDIIMESAININTRIPILILAIFSLGLTSFYSIRFSIVSMWRTQSSAAFINITEHKAIIKPIILLALISICTGRIMRWLPPVSQTLFILPQYIKLSPISIIFLGLLISWYITANTLPNTSILIKSAIFHYASCTIWYLVPLSTQFIIKWPMLLAHHFLKSSDQGWLELTSGNGIHKSLIIRTNWISLTTPKSPTSYLVISSTFTIIFLFIMYISSVC